MMLFQPGHSLLAEHALPAAAHAPEIGVTAVMIAREHSKSFDFQEHSSFS